MSVFVAIRCAVIDAAIGTCVGFLSAHARGWVKKTIMMMVDIQATVPFLVIALALLALFGNSLTLFVIIMGINRWEAYGSQISPVP